MFMSQSYTSKTYTGLSSYSDKKCESTPHSVLNVFSHAHQLIKLLVDVTLEEVLTNPEEYSKWEEKGFFMKVIYDNYFNIMTVQAINTSIRNHDELSIKRLVWLPVRWDPETSVIKVYKRNKIRVPQISGKIDFSQFKIDTDAPPDIQSMMGATRPLAGIFAHTLVKRLKMRMSDFNVVTTTSLFYALAGIKKLDDSWIISKVRKVVYLFHVPENKMIDKNAVGHQIERFITSQDPTDNTINMNGSVIEIGSKKIFVSSEIDAFNKNGYITEIKSSYVKSESSKCFIPKVKDREILQCMLNGSSTLMYVYHNGSEVISTKNYRVDHLIRSCPRLSFIVKKINYFLDVILSDSSLDMNKFNILRFNEFRIPTISYVDERDVDERFSTYINSSIVCHKKSSGRKKSSSSQKKEE